jgi:hypothetical protein
MRRLPNVRLVTPLVLLLPFSTGCGRTQTAPLAAGPAATTSSTGTSEQRTTKASERKAVKLADLKDERIDESSGLGASRRYPGYFWTHNDSGDSERLFLVSRDGDTAGVVTLPKATNLDWEDMAVAGTAESSWVYVADIGDNLSGRPAIAVYRFREPEFSNISGQTSGALPIPNGTTAPVLNAPTALNKDAPQQEVASEQITLFYPDGPHDAETLLATPDGHLLLVTKNQRGSAVYVTPKPFANGERQTLKKRGPLQFDAVSLFSRLLTGGDLSPDGTRLVLRTYTHAHEWQLTAPYSVDDKWWIRKAATFVLPSTRQGESVAYALDNRTIVTTSEKTPAPLWQITSDGALGPLHVPDIR